MKELVIKTPAKINIGLNIISKRDDGYHNLETIFYPINLFDELTIRKAEEFSLTSNHSGLNSEKQNTIIKAKELISQLTGIEIKTNITLDKRIPIGAGMGGGSSDGAAALLAFNNIYSLKLAKDDLFSLALKIGSDAPYFIDPLPKLAYSRGEVFEHISLIIKKPILIVNPGIHISTSKAFSSIVPKIPQFRLERIGSEEHNNISNYYDSITNDFESIVFKEYPEVKSIKDRLYDWGAEFSLMTGSGSTVFGIFPDITSAQAAVSKLPANYFTFIDQYDGHK
jgi:4-diphosphocytidyl-2-C-methyl-D-erythritol kinase